MAFTSAVRSHGKVLHFSKPGRWLSKRPSAEVSHRPGVRRHPRCANLINMAAWPEQFTLSKDVNEVAWIELDSWIGMDNTRVTSVVPRGFATYVRVFHPVQGPSGLLRWSDVARRTGRTMHPLAQWKQISPDADGSNAPPQGEPPAEVLIPLVSTLRGFTPDPGQCFFAIWDGWGQLHSGSFGSFRFPGQPKGVATPVEQFVSDRGG